MENKIKSKQPNQKQASALLEYIAMEDSKIKEVITTLSGNEIKSFLKWVNNYSKKSGIPQEEILNNIIENTYS